MGISSHDVKAHIEAGLDLSLPHEEKLRNLRKLLMPEAQRPTADTNNGASWQDQPDGFRSEAD